MSGLLAGELARGSLDFLASTPRARARVALEKVGGYLLALLLTTRCSWSARSPRSPRSGRCRATRSASTRCSRTRRGCTSWRWSPARSPSPSRRSSAAAAAWRSAGSPCSRASSSAATHRRVSALQPLEPLSYFSITAGHRPIAGAWDWPAVAGVAGAAVVLLGDRRRGLRSARPPRPDRRADPDPDAADLPGRSVHPGARRAAARVDRLGRGARAVRADHPFSVDEFVATLVVDPGDRRPDPAGLPGRRHPVGRRVPAAGVLLRGDPHREHRDGGARRRLGVRRERSATGAAPVAAGQSRRLGGQERPRRHGRDRDHDRGHGRRASSSGHRRRPRPAISARSRSASPSWASTPLAIAGIGLAVGGLVRPGLAAPVALILAIGFFLWDLIGSIVGLSDELLDLALQRHLGQPILGQFDWPGMAACALLAVGGIALCALGMRRRDIGR